VTTNGTRPPTRPPNRQHGNDAAGHVVEPPTPRPAVQAGRQHLSPSPATPKKSDLNSQNADVAAEIHNATLMHDDVVDESALRRGKPSANIAFGNAASVLVGDFLYTRAFQLMVRTGNNAVIAMMADAVNLIAAGEVMQLGNMHDPDVDEARYYRVIELKTAVLFAAACKTAGLLAELAAEKSEQLAVYGRKLGMAFQIMDDLLDYTGDEALIGKSLGDDLATPYQQAVTMAKQLESGHLLTYDGPGHGSVTSGNACVDETVAAYFEDGTLPEEGKTCS